MKGRQKF